MHDIARDVRQNPIQQVCAVVTPFYWYANSVNLLYKVCKTARKERQSFTGYDRRETDGEWTRTFVGAVTSNCR